MPGEMFVELVPRRLMLFIDPWQHLVELGQGAQSDENPETELSVGKWQNQGGIVVLVVSLEFDHRSTTVEAYNGLFEFILN